MNRVRQPRPFQSPPQEDFGQKSLGLCPAGTFRDQGEHKRLRDTRSGTRDIPGHVKISGTGNSEKILSPDGKGSIVVLGGGEVFDEQGTLYGTDLTEMRCLCTGVPRF